ncbi:unnamed protein product [Musa textilis]
MKDLVLRREDGRALVRILNATTKSLEHATSTATTTLLMKLLHGTTMAMAPTLSRLWSEEACTSLACTTSPEGHPEAWCLLPSLQCTKSIGQRVCKRRLVDCL